MKTIYQIGGRVLLSGPGKVAFPVIIALGAIIGILSYMAFSQASPGPLLTPAKLFEPVPSAGPATGEIREDLEETTTAGGEQQADANESQAASIPPNAVTITILKGASVQGNPGYDPETAQVGIDQTVAWKNDDSTAHTATSSKLFDSSLIDPRNNYSIAAEKIGAGEHSYSCTVHPFMKGTIVIK